MKAHLMYRDRDFDSERPLPPNEAALIQDLELNVLFRTMAAGDDFLFKVAKWAVLLGPQDGLETILYRQAVLKDCLKNTSVVEELYSITVEAIEAKSRQWLGIFGNYPGSILSGGVSLLDMLMGKLGQLKDVGEREAPRFQSEGFSSFFTMLKDELAPDYFAAVKGHLRELRFNRGVLISAQLGKGNVGTDYVLRESIGKKPGWFRRMLARRSAFTFYISDRDAAGARALSELNDRGINSVANSVAQSADHVVSFFKMLRTELAFYLGCVNLHRQLAQKGVPVSFPVPMPLGTRKHSCVGLRDACLALSMNGAVVGNDLKANCKNIVVVTGANQGGKSAFLRGVGVAQHMMQCGMYVAAESFSAEICRRVFTHYKREEDKTMTSGKFDEELNRMSGIVDALEPDSLVLFNESFAATNEREGSEIARHIVRALLEARVKDLLCDAHVPTCAYPVGGKGKRCFVLERGTETRRPANVQTATRRAFPNKFWRRLVSSDIPRRAGIDSGHKSIELIG